MTVADTNGRGPFPATRWTLIERVRSGGNSAARALEELCSMYWYPVYVYARRTGASPSDAEDLTQGFFARLLARGDLAGVETGKGRLRSYLLGSLKNFSISEHHKRNALKRGGGTTIVSIDAARAEERFQEEPAEIEDPAHLFERRWALTLLEEAFARTRQEYEKSGRGELFATLSPLMAGRVHKSDRYRTLGEQLDLSAGAVQVAVHRLRKRYRGHLEEAVAETVDSTEDAEEELHYVLRILGA